MSPSSQFHAKKEITTTDNNNNDNALLPPHLKINKDSHFIKKSSSSSSPSSSSSSTSSTSFSLPNSIKAPATATTSTSNKPSQRRPVIIYTHSPKIIHTNPKDFMTLVQKLTGLSRSDDDSSNKDGNLQQSSRQMKQEPSNNIQFGTVVSTTDKDRDCKKLVVGNEDNETSSVITEENNCCSSMGENQVNSYFMLPIMDPPMNPYMANLPMFTTPSTAEFMSSSHQPLLNESDSMFFSHSMRTSVPSSTTLEGVNEFHEYWSSL